MKVLVAPDKFTGTLTASEAARAIAEGWARRAPRDILTLRPMADGGPGFVDVMHEALGGELSVVTVPGPFGLPVPVTILKVDGTAYLESAQACGSDLFEAPDAWNSSTRGVGEAVRAAIEAGAAKVVVGLGGSGTNDGGAGFLAALGATADKPLDQGPRGLEGVREVDISAVHHTVRGIELVAATDVDSQLLGMFGATKTFGPQKGLSDDDILAVDRILDGYVVAACGSTPAERRVADQPRAGAAGGLGFALMVAGGTAVSGIGLVAEASGLARACAENDLVVSGEGTFDHTSRSGKAIHGVAMAAAQAARPCIALAGQVTVGAREIRAMGVESAYAVADAVGLERALAEPYSSLCDLAERVARTWSR